jgi:putative peptidoglycan lipid II flippase
VVFQRILYPAFYARKDTMTPMLLTFLGVGVQVAAAVTLFPRIGVLGLGLSVALAAWVQVVAAGWMTMRRGFWQLEGALLGRLVRCALAAGVMGAVLYVAKLPLLPYFGAGNAWEKIPSMAALVVVGGLVYILISVVMNAVPPSAMAALRRFRRPPG